MAIQRIWVCNSNEIREGGYLRSRIAYDHQPTPVLVFRYQGRCMAYKNRCVHMPRELDGELPAIFDISGRYLRCSMHGITFDPLTGESRSEICQGQRLTPVGILEDEFGVWIEDRHASPLAPGV